ncbi:MAG: glutamate racemase [Candidatus Cloacimonetes bacterium]|nr:glutamate racemase [Candidatus Cloacimonadota bacterium]
MNNPIGIFDSGVGGLTVFDAIRRKLPAQDIVYFGDTARVPYGSKSQSTIIRYSFENASFLVRQNIKLLIVACNTSSAYALYELKKKFDLPIIGVIEPGARKAVEITKNRRIGIIGTEGTIKSGAYEKAIKRLNENCEIFCKPTPLFVPLVEENWIEHSVTKQVIEEYLKDLMNSDIDTLILGCTHYPVLKNMIREVIGNEITLVDSAESVAEEIMRIHLFENYEKSNSKAKYQFFVSDNPQKFEVLGRRILNLDLEDVEMVYFAEMWVKGR